MNIHIAVGLVGFVSRHYACQATRRFQSQGKNSSWRRRHLWRWKTARLRFIGLLKSPNEIQWSRAGRQRHRTRKWTVCSWQSLFHYQLNVWKKPALEEQVEGARYNKELLRW